MRLIDADKIDFNEVFKGQSDFAKDTREAAQSLIDAQPTAFDVGNVIKQFKEQIEENGKIHSMARFEWISALEMVNAAMGDQTQ